MSRPTPNKHYSYIPILKSSFKPKGQFLVFLSFMKSFVSGISGISPLFSIRRSAEQFSFSIDSTKNSGLIRLILLTFLAFAAIQGEIRAQIAQRGSATTNAVALSGSSRIIAINKPTGVVAGDVLIASIVQNETDNDNGGLSDATLSGWTFIRGGLIRSDGTGNGNNAWWGTYLYRIADGTEGDSFSFSMPNDRADMAIGSIVAFSGVSTTGGVGPSGTGTGPFDVATSSFTTGNDDTPTVSGITVSSDAAVVFLAQVNNDRSYSSWVDGSNSLSLTELFDNVTATGDDASVGAAWGIISSAGSTGTTEVTISGSNRWGAVLLALRQAPIQKRFRSATTGNWSTNSTWQQSTNGGTSWVAATSTPTAADISVTIQNSHTVTLTAAASSPTLTINSGGTLTPGANLLTLNEDFINNGTLTSGLGGITLAGTSDQSIAGFTTTGTVSMTKTGGTATFQGNVNGAGLTINGSGGTLNLGTGLTHTFTGTWTRTNGTLNGGSSTLRLGGSLSGTGGTFTAGTGTVDYNGAAQTMAVLTYNNLTLSGSGGKTFNTGTTTVNGILSIENGTSTNTFTGTLAYGASATLQYNAGSSNRTVSSEWPATWANASNGVIVRGTGTITLNGNKALSNRPLTVIAGANLAVGSNTLGGVSSLNLEAGGTSSGALISGTGLITLTGNISVTDNTGGTAGAAISAPVVLGATRTITVADDGTSATDLTLSGVISGSSFGLTKAGAGTLTVSGNNTYTGTTTITEGILQLVEANRIANGSNLIMNGGTFRSGASAGVAETMGTVSLSENSTIALGTGDHTLLFSASSGATWAAGRTLAVTGWTGSAGASGTAGKLRIGTTTSGLSTTQLSQFRFDGFEDGAMLLANGEVVPPSVLPVITSSLTASSTYGTAATYTITASNTPTSFNATGLPAGMSVNTTTGEITVGAATNAGTYNITISATNGAGTDTKTLVYTVNRAASTVTVKSGTTSSFTFTGSAQGPGVSNFDFTGSTGDRSVLYTGVAPTTYNSATPPTNAGSYQVIATVASDANFNAASSSAFAFAITKATAAITPDSGQFKIIGEAEPILRYQSTGWIGPDTSSQLEGSLSRTEGEVQGNYPITLGTLAVTNPNYSLAFTSGVSFEIRNISATQYIISVNTTSPRAGTAVTVSAQLADQNGNGVAESGRILTWSELIGASGSFSSATSVTNAQGIATVQFTTSSTTGVSTQITASGSGGLFGTSPEITTVDAVPTQLVFVQDPSGSTTVAGEPFASQPIVQIRDAEGNLVSTATKEITLSLLEGSGELRGTVILNAVNGVATFSGLNIDLVGSDKVLLVEAEGLESDTTAAFTITAAQASLFTKYAGDQQVAQVGTAVDIAPAVRITDIFGNPISNVSVSFAVSSGGGSIAPTTAILTNEDGVASLTSWTLGTTAGQNSLIASTTGLSPSTFTALGSEDAIATFTSSTTWTVPPGVTSIIVEGWGGGGAGGGANSGFFGTRAGAGGGGGAYSKASLSVQPGDQIQLDVGAGGSPVSGGNGGNGTDTFIDSFPSFLAKGGSGGGGNSGSVPAGGIGGTEFTGDPFAGENGAAGGSTTSGKGGKGGESRGGAGGESLTSNNSGVQGQAPGGGGSGARISGFFVSRAGGAGGDGKISITYPLPVDQFRAAVSGNWEDAATWEQQFSNGQYAKIETKPESSSTVIISKPGLSVQGTPASVTVTVSEDLNFTGSITVTSEGELALSSGKNLTLTSGSALTIGNEGILTLPANGLVLGAGNVAINRGSTLSIAHPDGVKATGTSGGAIQNTGTRTFSAEANYHYNGTAAQVIGNGLPAIVNGLTIDNPTIVTLDRPLEVKVDLGVNSGVFELNETLTIDFGMALNGTSQVLVKPGKTFQADLLANLVTNGTSRVVINPGAKYLNLGISTPRLEVQQRLTGARGWRMLGSPVTGANYQSFLTGLESQGFPGSANPTLQANVLWWDEQDGGTTVQGWRQPGNISQSVPAGRGHYVFVFNGAAKKAAGSGNYSDALPLTLSTIGDEVNLNTGGFNFGVTFTERNIKFQGNTTTGDYTQAGAANEGFNLISNPTSSDIDFFKSTGWTKTNIDQTIYIWDQNYNNGQGDFIEVTSETALANRIIAPYQAFWVRTNDESPSLIMNNEVKAAEFSAFYGRVLADVPATPGSKINLRLSGEGMLADASIRISEQGEDGLDPWDAFQLESLNNNWLNLYTLGSPKELIPLVINHLSMPEEGEKTIPLYMAAAKEGKAFSGNYTLNWALPADLPADTRVVLMDHISKQAIDMSEIQSYSFSFQAPTTTNARIRTDDGEMKQPQAVVFSHEIKEGIGENYRTAAGQVTRPFTIVIGYTGQGTDPEYRPETPKLYTPSPNPFQEMTQIKFYIPIAEEVEVKVYDMKGQEVGSFERATYPAGINFLEWRPSAVQLPKGMYLIQVQTSSTVMSQKVIKL